MSENIKAKKMNSSQDPMLESNIPRRGRPRKNPNSSPSKSKPSLGPSPSGVRKSKPRAVKLMLPHAQTGAAAAENKVKNKSSESVKPFAQMKDSKPVTTFLLTPADGKTGALTPMTKSASGPMTLVQKVKGSDSMKTLPVAGSSSLLPRGQVTTSLSSTQKLLLITTASNSAVSLPTTSTNQTYCKSLLPVKLNNNNNNNLPTTSTNQTYCKSLLPVKLNNNNNPSKPGSVSTGNLSKQVFYKIPSSQSSGMVLLSTTAPSQSGMVLLSTTSPSQSGGPPKKFLLIPSPSATKRPTNNAVILNSKIPHSVDLGSDKPVIAIASSSPAMTCIKTCNDSNATLPSSVPVSSNSSRLSSPVKPLNTSRRRGSVLGANSTISSIPSDIFKTVACTTNARGICSTPVAVQPSKKQKGLKVNQYGSSTPYCPLVTAPIQQDTFSPSPPPISMIIPTVPPPPPLPESSIKANPLTTNSPLLMSSPSNNLKLSDEKDPKPNTVHESTPVIRYAPLPGRRAKKTVSKSNFTMARGGGGDATSSSFLTVPSTLPFSAIQLKPNCSNRDLTTPASGVPTMSWVVSPNAGHLLKPNLQKEIKGWNVSSKYQSMPKLILVNGIPIESSSANPSTNGQTGRPSPSQHSSQYTPKSKTSMSCMSPPKLTIAPGFSPQEKTGLSMGEKKRPSELMIIKEREEFIDDSMENSSHEELSPPKLQREDGPDLNRSFNFEMPQPMQSYSYTYLPLLKTFCKPGRKPHYNKRSLLQSPLLSSPTTNTMAIQNEFYCQDIKPIINKDSNLDNLSPMKRKNSKLIHFDKNRRQLPFEDLFNHFRLLAKQKKNKTASKHSSLMLKVAYSIHCCVVLTSMDLQGRTTAVNLNDVPFSNEKFFNCSMKCRQKFLKQFFVKKNLSSLLDSRPQVPVFNPHPHPQTMDDLPAQDDDFRTLSKNSFPQNETTMPLSSNPFPGSIRIKTEIPDPIDEYQTLNSQPLTNITDPYKMKSGTTSKTEKLSSYKELLYSIDSDSKCLVQSTSVPSLYPNKVGAFEKVSKQAFQFESHENYNNPMETTTKLSARLAKGKHFQLCNGRYKKLPTPTSLLETKTKNRSKKTSDPASTECQAISFPTSPPAYQLASGKLRYKIVPKGHISLCSKSPEKDSVPLNDSNKPTKVPYQSYIINSDKRSMSPIQAINRTPVPSRELCKDQIETSSESRFSRKRKKRLSSPEKTRKKINLGCTKTIGPPEVGSPFKSPKKESCSQSTCTNTTAVPFLERPPSSLKDTKHLYDEPTMVDRVVMLTPDGKPILTDTDLQISFDESIRLLTSPKKKSKSVKQRSLKTNSSSNSSSFSLSCIKGQESHSKSPFCATKQFSRPPTLKFLLREIEQKSKNHPLSLLTTTATSTPKLDLSIFPGTSFRPDKSKKTRIENIVHNIASGFPAFGRGKSRCTMKLYKYFVETRLKNRAKKNGSHDIDVPLTLYVNWKTLSRQPFNKHRITNHTLNVMAIKNAKKFCNYKKCKSRSKMVKPVKNRPLFMTRRKGFRGLSHKKLSVRSNKLTKRTTKKTCKLPSHPQQNNKSKTPMIKPSTFVKTKKNPKFCISSSSTKKKQRIATKSQKTLNKLESAPIFKRPKSKILVKKKVKNKAAKFLSRRVKVLPQLKTGEQSNEKIIKSNKTVHLTHSSTIPVMRATRSRRLSLSQLPPPDSIKVEFLPEMPCPIKSEPTSDPDPKSHDLAGANQLNIKKNRDKKRPNLHEPPSSLKDDLRSSRNKSNLSTELDKPVDNLSTERDNLPTEADHSVDNLSVERNKPEIKVKCEKEQIDKKPLDQPDSQTKPEKTIGSDISDSGKLNTFKVSASDCNINTELRTFKEQQGLTSSIQKCHSKDSCQSVNSSLSFVPERKDNSKSEHLTQSLPLTSTSDSLNENQQTTSPQQQSVTPSLLEDSGNIIFEDDVVEPDKVPSLCKQDQPLSSSTHHSNPSPNPFVLSQSTNSEADFSSNLKANISSSAFSEKFDIGLSPQLARIQQLKDRLQEKQKALDLAKLYLK